MLRSVALALVKSRLGNIQGTDLDDVIIANMQLVQTTVLEGNSSLPWFLRTDTTTEGTGLTTSNGVEYVALPTKFLRLDEDTEYPVLRVDSEEDSGYYALTEMDYTIAIGRYTGTEKPKHYSIRGEKIFFRPVPNDVYSIRLFYYKGALTLDSDIENLWLKWAPDWMLAETCRQTAEDLQYTALIEKFAADGEKAQARVYRESIARLESGFMRMMGDD